MKFRAAFPRRTLRSSLAAGAATVLFAPVLVALWRQPAAAADNPRLLPAPAVDAQDTQSQDLQTAVLAGGCFWGVQAVFEHVRGVRQVVSGYSGGKPEQVDYETVSTGTTGHAESVRITYDPMQISYGQILRIFFSVALDPTEVNRQGPDHGTQYRSEIFTSDPEQARVARAYIAQLDAAHAFRKPIATRVDPLTGFYPAEAYHQDYLVRHPDSLYIVANDLPKVAALQQFFPEIYVAAPTTVYKVNTAR
jgi:peptide-methionine (S)-S-oxide reductase